MTEFSLHLSIWITYLKVETMNFQILCCIVWTWEDISVLLDYCFRKDSCMRVRGMVHSWFWPFIKFCGTRILFLLFSLATQKIVCAELSEEYCLNCEQKRSAESTECLAFLQHQALLFTWLFMVLNTKGY